MRRRVHRVIVVDEHHTALEMPKAVLVDDLRLPLHIALGALESATQEEINDLITDLTAELERR